MPRKKKEDPLSETKDASVEEKEIDKNTAPKTEWVEDHYGNQGWIFFMFQLLLYYWFPKIIIFSLPLFQFQVQRILIMA